MDKYQEAAVEDTHQYLQIIGGPGSGKTHVLASRITRLLNCGVAPESIVALTFTHNACGALRQRVAQYVNDPDLANRVVISTYHTFCSMLITSHSADVGLTPGWRMTDFIDAHNTEYMTEDKDQLLKLHNMYGFQTALSLGRKILESHSSSYSHLLLDEFQDSSASQWNLVCTMLASNPQLTLTAVGDPNQEIYTFLSDHFPLAFSAMKLRFPETKVLKLHYNYRSSRKITAFCNQIFPTGIESTTSDEGVVARVLHNPGCATDAMAQLIHDLPFEPRDIAVLTRTNTEVQEIMADLREHEVPVSPLFGFRSTAVRRLPNIAITLLKWAHYNNDAHLLQLMYNRHYKFINKTMFDKLVESEEDGNRSVMNQLELLKPKQTDFLAWLRDIRTQLINSKSVAEVVDIVRIATLQWKARAQPRRIRPEQFTLSELSAWKILLNIMEKLPNYHELQPGEAVAVLLRQIFASEGEKEPHDNQVSVLTMHGAKSKQWPVVIASYQPGWNGNFTTDNKLAYVTASRAMKRLYYFNGGAPEKTDYMLPAPVPDTVQYSRITGLSYPEALKRDPLVFKPIFAKRIITRVIKI